MPTVVDCWLRQALCERSSSLSRLVFVSLFKVHTNRYRSSLSHTRHHLLTALPTHALVSAQPLYINEAVIERPRIGNTAHARSELGRLLSSVLSATKGDAGLVGVVHDLLLTMSQANALYANALPMDTFPAFPVRPHLIGESAVRYVLRYVNVMNCQKRCCIVASVLSSQSVLLRMLA